MFDLCSSLRMEPTDQPPATPSRPRKPRRKRAPSVRRRMPTLPPGPDGTPRDPDDYDWVPVRRTQRADGWTRTRQRLFIETLADTGSVEMAAHAVDMTRQSCYKLRRAPGSEGFNAAWSAAIEAASAKLIDEAFERALVGSSEPVFDRQGRVVGRRFRQSDRMLMFLLRAYLPERFRYASHAVRPASEPAPPPRAPVATMLEHLDPPRPAEPHNLMPPAALENALLWADFYPGELPSKLRDLDPLEEKRERTNPMPLGEDFERGLENAKRETSGEPPLTDAEWAEHRAALLRKPESLWRRKTL